MSIKLTILKSGETIISDAKELIVEEWFGLENDMTREVNNKKRRKQCENLKTS